MKTPVNAYTLKNHFTYSWWKYLLVLIAGIFLVDLLFTVTRPRTPENKKVDFYVYGFVNSEALTAYMDEVHQQDLPDMEEVTFNALTSEDTYGPMQLTTYIAVQEGDLYLLPREQFISFAGTGAFLPLEDDEELMALFNDAGKSLRRGWRTLTDSDETHLYGIPVDQLPGILNLAYAEDGFLAVLAANGNTENVMKFLRRFARDTITEPAPSPSPVPEPSPVP